MSTTANAAPAQLAVYTTRIEYALLKLPDIADRARHQFAVSDELRDSLGLPRVPSTRVILPVIHATGGDLLGHIYRDVRRDEVL